MKPAFFMEAEARAGRSPALWRWAAPLAAMALLFAVGAGLGLVDEAQQQVSKWLSSVVRTRWADGSAGALAQAAWLLTIWIAWRVVRKAALFAAFYAAERALPGRPIDRKALRYAIAVQLTLALLYGAGATFLLVVAPFPALPAPVVNIAQAEVASLIGPLAPVVLALAALLAYDFIDYWVHRAQHRFAFLWRFHAVHHSIEEMDSLSSYSHPFDLLLAYAAFVLAGLLIGFTYETMLLFLAFRAIQGRLAHTRAPVNFGPLGAVLVDNRVHYLHHTRAEARSGKNFAGTFTICDRLFGTFEKPAPGPLTATGLEERGPPATVRDFLLARLDQRRPAAPKAELPLSPALPAAG